MHRIGRCAAVLAAVVGLLAGCGPHRGASSPRAQAAAERALTVRTVSVGLGLRPPAAEVPPANAQALNAARPDDPAPIEPMRPFVLKAGAADRARAVECLTQAVYYEAAREPLAGQQAVAQVVLNRVRHPAYPKSVCGVVYQGAARGVGCQFTFTCDGSLRWRPEPALWRRAETVARRALAGYVDGAVGSATHYHADYVSPYWAPNLLKMTQVGAHIFYRWSGDWGRPAAFVGRYGGHEADLPREVLTGGDPRLAAPETRQVTLPATGGARTYKVVDAAAPGGVRTRVAGVLRPTRPAATPEQIRRINADLEALEKRMDADAGKAAAAASAPAAATAAVATVPEAATATAATSPAA